jgi:hypothetical protein
LKPLIVVGASLIVLPILMHPQRASAQPLLAGQQPYRDNNRERANEEIFGSGTTSSPVVDNSIPATMRGVRADRTGALTSAATTDPWPGRRVLLLLPLRTGSNWKANREFTQALLSQAQASLRTVLNGSGKFSLLEVKRFNPVLMRAVQDGVATSDDLNTLLAQPTTPNAMAFLSKVSFNAAPRQAFSAPAVIGSFVLENVELTEDNALRVKVTGRMYAPDSPEVIRALSATTTVPFSTMSGVSMRVPALTAFTTGLNRIVSEFVRYPSERETLMAEPAATPTPAAPAATPTPAEKYCAKRHCSTR